MNSPFVVGVCGDTNLDLGQLTTAIDGATRFLRDLGQHLPDTRVRVLVDSSNNVGLAMASAASALGVPVDVRCNAPGEVFDDLLIRRSNLLLVMWDGRLSGTCGQPGEVVCRFLGIQVARDQGADSCQIVMADDDPESVERPVFWVPAGQHRGAAARDCQPCFLLAAGDDFLQVQRKMPATLQRELADLNEFNAEFARLNSQGSLALSESLRIDENSVIAPEIAPALENIDAQYVKADSLAIHNQRRSDRLFDLFGVMAFTMGLAYLTYEKITESRLLLIAYVFVLITSVLAYHFLHEKRWFGKHLAYRALAETLRARFYLTLAGIDHRMCAGELITLAGIDKFLGFSWIRFILDSIESAPGEAFHSNETFSSHARLVDQEWVDTQYRYFARKVAKMEKESRRVKHLKSAVLLVILMVISAMFIFGDVLDHVDARLGLPVKNVMTFCMGFLAVLLGVWELRQNKMATRELLWQYRNQLSLFARAKMQLAQVRVRSGRDDLILELGKNSLMEIYLWAIHRYHREHAPPTGP